ncbi:hypothetical protein DO73_4613 [Burkholderia pseudomallei]|nr:hypothetical protein DO73_4613 [Burkholderia pseudomallei]
MFRRPVSVASPNGTLRCGRNASGRFRMRSPAVARYRLRPLGGRRAERARRMRPLHRRALDRHRRTHALRRPPARVLDPRVEIARRLRRDRLAARFLQAARREQHRSSRERRARARPGARREPAHEAPNRRGREQIAGAVVERLNGQRHRAVGAGFAHAGRRDARARLHEAVEAPAAAPGPAPAIRVERHVDEAGVDPPPLVGVEAETVERARPVAVDHHVGLADQAAQQRAPVGAGEVGARAPLAEHDFGHRARLVPADRIDAQHLCAEAREKARRDGAREDARQIEHAHAAQRPLGRHRPRGARAVDTHVVVNHQRLRAHRAPLRIARPFVLRAHDGRAAAVLDDRRFERVAAPLPDRAGDGLPLGRRAEHGERGRAMMRRVRVQPDPAVGRAVVARDRIPQRRHVPAARTQRRAEPDRCVAAIDTHAGQPARRAMHELGERDARRADRGRGEIGDRKGRRQHARAAECQRAQPLGIAVRGLPDVAQIRGGTRMAGRLRVG